MADSYEDALRHAREIAEIQARKRKEGKVPACPPMRKPHDPNKIHFAKLRNKLKTERAREITRHPERRITNQGERHRQPVMCIETGEIFHTLKELSERIGLTSATISIQMTKNKKIQGFTYTRITKEDEKNKRKR